MVTINEMAEGYIKQVTFRITEAEKDLLKLKQHLEECLNELEFGSAQQSCKANSCKANQKTRNLKEEIENEGGETVSTAPLNSEQHGVVNQEAT